ncbi:sensor histidine kinase [Aquibacillus kalidii]|uniref:sensor histidine kinase n=1 Tax=Aquibacillus kalidii TaxID=2762597 RepID=UPI0016452547|nr:HAMP domain-containing sensor histidine kinase [Aquibacillus kalidii]
MKLNSVVIKLGATILFLQLIILIPLGYIIVQIILNFSYNDVENQLIDLSQKYAENIQSISDEETFRNINNIADITDMEAVVTDIDGKIRMNTEWDNLLEHPVLNQKELKQLNKKETIVNEYINKEAKYLKVGQPIIHNGKVIGSIFLFSPLHIINESIQNIIKLVVLASLGAVILAIGFTFFISKKLAAPLLQMEHATKRIANKQDFSTRVTYKGNDEIGSLANAINNMSSTLERYQTNRNEFFSNITHELKTPLTYIKGYTQAIRKNLYQSDNEKNDYLKIIENEANQINTLMDDLMDLSKIEEGKLPFHMEDLELNELIETIITKVQFKANQKNIDVHFSPSTSVALLYADGNRMEQIFNNLLENAIRYTEKGSIKVNLINETNGITVKIADTGIGIAKSDLPYLFDRFYRVDKSRSRSNGGTGLGLSIVKKLVETHNGTIEFQSEKDQGTTVILYFPNDSHE